MATRHVAAVAFRYQVWGASCSRYFVHNGVIILNTSWFAQLNAVRLWPELLRVAPIVLLFRLGRTDNQGVCGGPFLFSVWVGHVKVHSRT